MFCGMDGVPNPQVVGDTNSDHLDLFFGNTYKFNYQISPEAVKASSAWYYEHLILTWS